MTTPILAITALYAGLLGLILMALMVHVGGQRGKTSASLGTDATPELQEAVRRFGNFVEWVPFVLILMALAEASGLAHLYLHAIGIVLVIARILHPFGLRHNRMAHPARAAGAGRTFLIAAVPSGFLLWHSIAG